MLPVNVLVGNDVVQLALPAAAERGAAVAIPVQAGLAAALALAWLLLGREDAEPKETDVR
jgi:hypothetical protein